MAQREAIELLNVEFHNAFKSLVECYKNGASTIRDAASIAKSLDSAAMIGFSAEGLRGAATLFTDASDAVHLGGPPEASFEDWLGELANQTIGRFKNKIYEFGVSVCIGLPTTMTGLELRPSGRHYMAWQTEWNGFELFATLQMEVRYSLKLVHNPEAQSAAEGSLSLF